MTALSFIAAVIVFLTVISLPLMFLMTHKKNNKYYIFPLISTVLMALVSLTQGALHVASNGAEGGAFRAAVAAGLTFIVWAYYVGYKERIEQRVRISRM